MWGCVRIISSSAVLSCRFEFLQSWHQFNSYYEFKKNYFLQKEGRCFPEVRRPKPSAARVCVSRGEEPRRKKAWAAFTMMLAVVANAFLSSW